MHVDKKRDKKGNIVMKKLFALLLVFAVVGTAAGCRKAKSETDSGGDDAGQENTVQTSIKDEDYETVTIINGLWIKRGQLPQKKQVLLWLWQNRKKKTELLLLSSPCSPAEAVWIPRQLGRKYIK